MAMADSTPTGASRDRATNWMPEGADVVAMAMVLVGLALVLTMVIAVAVARYYPELPELDRVTEYQPRLPLQVFTSDGVEIAQFGSERRQF